MMLTLLIVSPLLGLLILLFFPSQSDSFKRKIGIIGTLPPLVIASILFAQLDRSVTELQFGEVREWFSFSSPSLSQLGVDFTVSYELGVDGLSLVLVLLTTVVATLAAIASTSITQNLRAYFCLYFFLEVGMLGVFVAQNLLLFFLFFEMTLIALFFLISKWGYGERERAAYQFLIYNGLGSAVILIAFAVIFVITQTMSFTEAAATFSLLDEGANDLKMGVLLALLIGFGVKLPIVPLHRWMLHVHVQAPPAIVMIHSGILLKIGAYGLFRFGFSFFPEQMNTLSVVLVILGLANLLYGAYLALIQTDLKLVLAYSSISHMGIVLLGMAAMNHVGVQGAVFQVVSHGLISALLFFLIGVFWERTGTSTIPSLGGLARSMPLASGFLLAGGLASLGLPGMSGFISEWMAFLGLFSERPIMAAIGTLGLILTAIYMLRAVLGVTFGPLKEKWAILQDIKGPEWIPALVLTGLIVLIGIYPNLLAEPLQQPIHLLLMRIGG
ncbi:complex I subunit 4 family protein [Halalkalibacterium ligniniphilum]|uniref:complex I subunit 4 family protein n=1 Tax=Halalkalibacterium ligniniphilum TaxID=1134413 RepID=UPI0003465BF7|nr:NADH-quinone oxidoreductase subunit M [Halalkalibacterium ligniniphilum]